MERAQELPGSSVLTSWENVNHWMTSAPGI